MASVHARLAGPLLAAALALAASLPIFDRSMNLLDEGHILQFADIVARGGELYRDATLLPLPGAFYLLAGAFELFGPSIRVARWIVVFEFALFCALGFALLRRMLSPAWAWAGVAVLLGYRVWSFPHWQLYSYSTTALLCIAGMLLALLHALDGSRRALPLAGLLAGLAVACKQDYGAAALLTANALLLVALRTAPAEGRERAWPQLLRLNAPAAAVGLLVLLHFARQGLLGEMLQQTVWNHLMGIATFEYTGLPPLRPLLAPLPLFREPLGFGTYGPSIAVTLDFDRIRSSVLYDTILWDLWIRATFYGPYLVLALGAVRLWRRRSALHDGGRRTAFLGELALWATGAGLFLVLNRPIDYVHVFVLTWPLWLLGLVWLRDVAARPRLRRALAVAGAVPALLAAGYTGYLAWQLRVQNDTPLRTDRAGVFVRANDEAVIGAAVDYVVEHSRPGERVAVLPYFPLISFLAGRDAPHRAIYTFWPIEYIPDRQRQIIEAMRAARPDFFVYHYTQFVQFPRMDAFAPELFAWLVDHYEVDRVFSDETWGYMLAAVKRSAGPPPGRLLWHGGAANASLFVEGPDGRQAVPAAERDAMLREALWPFRRVLALRPRAGERRSVLSLPLRVPEGARLRTAVSVHPTEWFRYPPRATTFSLRAAEGGQRTTLFSRRVDPHRDRSQRRWFEVDVPLDAWAGRDVALELVTEVERSEGELLEMGGWELPRLVTPADGVRGLD